MPPFFQVTLLFWSTCNPFLNKIGPVPKVECTKCDGKESDYPYTAADGTCQTTCVPAVTLTGHHDVPAKDEDALAAAVAIGPVSVAIEADKSAFQFYKSGVFDNAGCGTTLDHGVLAVGYGTLSGKDYWKVKNSW